jgi:hypothetical protein
MRLELVLCVYLLCLALHYCVFQSRVTQGHQYSNEGEFICSCFLFMRVLSFL